MVNGYKLILDVSHHQTFDYDLVKQHIDGVIIRVGFGTQPDSKFRQHYDAFKEIPCAAYQWFRPDQDVKAQIELVKTTLDPTEIQAVFSDQEQNTIYGTATQIAAATLNERGQAHVTGLATHGYTMGTYSRATWISQYNPRMLDWMYDYMVWLASWPYASGAVTTTWEALKATWSPKIFSPYFTSTWPAEKKRADLWQFSGDKFIVPGIYTATGVPRSADFNYISDAALEKFKPAAAPIPEPEPDPHLPVMETVYNELVDLRASMQGNMFLSQERAAQDINELTYIMGLLKPGGG
jgi:hypothetical protein